jgi:hypothetical protein
MAVSRNLRRAEWLLLTFTLPTKRASQRVQVWPVFDLDKHIPIAFLKLPGGPDVIKFDPGLARIYVACYSGAIAVFHQDDPDHYRKLEDFRVQHAVHSLAVDLKTHRVYAPEQEEDGKPVARMVVYEAVTN